MCADTVIKALQFERDLIFTKVYVCVRVCVAVHCRRGVCSTKKTREWAHWVVLGEIFVTALVRSSRGTCFEFVIKFRPPPARDKRSRPPRIHVNSLEMSILTRTMDRLSTLDKLWDKCWQLKQRANKHAAAQAGASLSGKFGVSLLEAHLCLFSAGLFNCAQSETNTHAKFSRIVCYLRNFDELKSSLLRGIYFL